MTTQTHEGQPLLSEGIPLKEAKGAMILLHGRGASAEDIMQLREDIKASDLAYLAPQATNNTWYPNRFLIDTSHNEPWLSSALTVVGKLVRKALDAGIAQDKIYLIGFSQGACLALEYAARNPVRYGGVFGLSGALIGGDNEERPKVEGSLAETPIFLGCSNVDPHIPAVRVRESAAILKDLGGSVMMKLYPLMGHTVNADEITLVRQFMGLEPLP